MVYLVDTIIVLNSYIVYICVCECVLGISCSQNVSRNINPHSRLVGKVPILNIRIFLWYKHFQKHFSYTHTYDRMWTYKSIGYLSYALWRVCVWYIFKYLFYTLSNLTYSTQQFPWSGGYIWTLKYVLYTHLQHQHFIGHVYLYVW